MSENTLPQEEQIEFLVRKVADLESICAFMFYRLADSALSRTENTLINKRVASEIRREGQAKYGPDSSLADNSAYSSVADQLVRFAQSAAKGGL